MYRKKLRKKKSKPILCSSSWPGWIDNTPPWEVGFFKYITHTISPLHSASLELWEWKFIRRFKRKNRTINEIKIILC